MKTTITQGVLWLAWLFLLGASAPAAQPVFPVKVSENGRYLVDQKGEPVFWLGTTQWQIFREYTLDEARTILEKTNEKGFVFVQAMLMGVGDGTQPNVHGEKPWIDDDPLTPNEAYFRNVDSVIQIARDNHIIFSVTLYHQRYRKCITLKNARAWAKWLARRYRDVPNIVWSMTPEARKEFIPILRELAAGLHEGDGGRHLVTFKPDPAPYSSSFIHREDWLDFNSMQTWNGVKLIYPMVTKDYNLKPVKPVLMAEGAYEAGSEYGFEVTPLWIRRQAYYSYLAGAHHTYGHNDSWRVLPTWKKALDAPGAVQMGILKRIFLARDEWWQLVPDQSVFTGGGRTTGTVLNLAARHKDGKWVMVYLADRASFSIDMGKITAAAEAKVFWVDPRTGDSVSVGRFSTAGGRSFSTPDGWEDAILVAEAFEGQESERRWEIQLGGFFRGGTKPVYLYARERGGQWIAVVGSSRDPDREGGKTYNRSWYYGDLSTVPIKDGKMKGQFTMHVTPDLWVPRDHKGYTIVFEIDAALKGADKMEGRYKVVAVGSKDESTRDFGNGGPVTGTSRAQTQPKPPEPVTFQCNMQGALVGGNPQYGGRCMVLWLGLEDGKLVSTIHGLLSQKFQTYSPRAFAVEGNTATANRDRLTARITVPTKTLDMEPCRHVFDIDGRLMEEVLVGTYKLTVKIDGKPDVAIDGSFDGKWDEGITRIQADDRPWYVPVTGFEPPTAGEHPRLLFRKSDLPALRKKAQTPEGKAIIKRLRYLLDGHQGQTMTGVFSNATHAYMGGGYTNTAVDTPGVYTFGHAAGYGLLYQLSGEKNYADFGRQCFERAMAGVRDRDDRYSFRKPGGALRAGPAIGWYAVGYDLCYDGWDAATREKLGRAIAEYDEGDQGKSFDLEVLARGTMPPGSNHFGMQVGGASLALLAISGEKWVDQKRVDTLLAVAQQSMVRNINEGFGDGGFFAEGDGTGSMASQIAYLSGLQAWKNVKGKDFINVQRPNARMLTLKWIYQTIVRDGRPDFWPIRGAYGHNVWSRQGLSGAGYFAIGFGGVTGEQKAAMKWYYNQFLLEADTNAAAPYDTASRYPHLSVCALVNWPVSLAEKNPAQVLPLCYRDSSCGFYAWRNRWQDADDTVITVLTNRTQGYMGAKPDRSLSINAMGRHLKWGTVKEGPTKHWSTSPRGQSSSLTLSDGTCFGVDFTGTSGADVMLVTTGKAEGPSVKLDGKTLTFYFPTQQTAPKVNARGNAAVVGRQRVTLKDGHLVFAATGK